MSNVTLLQERSSTVQTIEINGYLDDEENTVTVEVTFKDYIFQGCSGVACESKEILAIYNIINEFLDKYKLKYEFLHKYNIINMRFCINILL